MLSERQRHQALEIKQNASALSPQELLEFANHPSVPHSLLRAHLIESALLAKWAHDMSDDEPDPQFKMMEKDFLARVQ